MAEMTVPEARPSGLRAWVLLAAWAAGIAALAQLIAWANRWYVAGMFMRSATADADAAWAYRILDMAMQALVGGIVAALVATALALVARRMRR